MDTWTVVININGKEVTFNVYGDAEDEAVGNALMDAVMQYKAPETGDVFTIVSADMK